MQTKEWVCIEDYYSDEKQSGTVEAVRTNSEVQFSLATSRSVCLTLPSTDTVAESASSVSELIVSLTSAISPAPLTATAVVPGSGAHPQAPLTSPLAVAVAPARWSPFLAAQSGKSVGSVT